MKVNKKLEDDNILEEENPADEEKHRELIKHLLGDEGDVMRISPSGEGEDIHIEERGDIRIVSKDDGKLRSLVAGTEDVIAIGCIIVAIIISLGIVLKYVPVTEGGTIILGTLGAVGVIKIIQAKKAKKEKEMMDAVWAISNLSEEELKNLVKIFLKKKYRN